MSAARRRILVVEDDAFIGILLGEMLADLGHEVCGVERTEAGAVAAAVSQAPDLLIVDAQLAAGSGVAAVVQIQRAGWVPHVFISGGPIRAPLADAVVLQKPFDDIALARAIDQALALRARGG